MSRKIASGLVAVILALAPQTQAQGRKSDQCQAQKEYMQKKSSLDKLFFRLMESDLNEIPVSEDFVLKCRYDPSNKPNSKLVKFCGADLYTKKGNVGVIAEHQPLTGIKALQVNFSYPTEVGNDKKIAYATIHQLAGIGRELRIEPVPMAERILGKSANFDMREYKNSRDTLTQEATKRGKEFVTYMREGGTMPHLHNIQCKTMDAYNKAIDLLLKRFPPSWRENIVPVQLPSMYMMNRG